MTKQYELKLANGKTVVWEGTDAENAAQRYVDCHREAAVIATRPYSPPDVKFYGPSVRIIEP